MRRLYQKIEKYQRTQKNIKVKKKKQKAESKKQEINKRANSIVYSIAFSLPTN